MHIEIKPFAIKPLASTDGSGARSLQILARGRRG
jgi:hypothetical protein